MVKPVAGVLALQGSSEPHLDRLRELGVEAREVRCPEALEGLTHLILPGGESTTFHHLMELFGVRDAIAAHHRRGMALFGTCAGAILLGRDEGIRPPRFGLLDASFARNAYGRQIDSFTAEVPLASFGDPAFSCVFIRAPRIIETGPEVEILGRHGAEPILVRSGNVLAATFHPELTPDLRIHRYFVEELGPAK